MKHKQAALFHNIKMNSSKEYIKKGADMTFFSAKSCIDKVINAEQ